MVLRGETFNSISSKYGISEESLKKANPKATICYAGLKLVIPESSQTQNATYSSKSIGISNVQATTSNTSTKKNTQTQVLANKKVKKKNNFWKGALTTLGAAAVTAVVAVAVAESKKPGRTDGNSVNAKHTPVNQQQYIGYNNPQAMQQQNAYTPIGAMQTPDLSSYDNPNMGNNDEDNKRNQAEQYANSYYRYESLAMKVYDNLTSSGFGGYKTKDKKTGTETGHFTSGGDISITKNTFYLENKKSLRSYQEQMRTARRKAERLGMRIEKSKYEDITVNFN